MVGITGIMGDSERKKSTMSYNGHEIEESYNRPRPEGTRSIEDITGRTYFLSLLYMTQYILVVDIHVCVLVPIVFEPDVTRERIIFFFALSTDLIAFPPFAPFSFLLIRKNKLVILKGSCFSKSTYTKFILFRRDRQD